MQASFEPNLGEIRFALELCEFPNVMTGSGHGADAGPNFSDVLREAGRFASNVLSPINAAGDRYGCSFSNGRVRLPPGFEEAYRKYAGAGWNGLGLPVQYGGQQLPVALVAAVSELFNTANMALTTGLMPVIGAVSLIHHFGTPEQKNTYIPKIASGEWLVTMVITEPQAGSDVGAIRTQAIHDGHGYRISGQKSLITFGEHDLTDNIIHLVLARSPHGPEGTKGLSLFIVPKRLPDGALNDISCIGLENKMGLRGSPTATLVFGERSGALGELLGVANMGLEHMFVLMNRARLNVGIFGLASAEGARQAALRYAQQRIQGRDLAGRPAAIVQHPDVRRMIVSMTSRTEAARYIAYYTASLIDRAADGADKATLDRLEIMTPITKAWCTENGFEVASLGVQIHGGIGYSEECDASQYFREARVHTIYEGTTGVQANDLIFRKIKRDQGAAVKTFLAEMRHVTNEAVIHADEPLQLAGRGLDATLIKLEGVTESILRQELPDNGPKLRSNSAHYLMFFGTCVAAWLSLQAAVAAKRVYGSRNDGFADRKMWQALFFVQQVVPPAAAMSEAIERGGDAVLQCGLASAT